MSTREQTDISLTKALVRAEYYLRQARTIAEAPELMLDRDMAEANVCRRGIVGALAEVAQVLNTMGAGQVSSGSPYVRVWTLALGCAEIDRGLREAAADPDLPEEELARFADLHERLVRAEAELGAAALLLKPF